VFQGETLLNIAVAKLEADVPRLVILPLAFMQKSLANAFLYDKVMNMRGIRHPFGIGTYRADRESKAHPFPSASRQQRDKIDEDTDRTQQKIMTTKGVMLRSIADVW